MQTRYHGIKSVCAILTKWCWIKCHLPAYSPLAWSVAALTEMCLSISVLYQFWDLHGAYAHSSTACDNHIGH